MKKKKLAVIGSGISGLSSSFFLSKNFDVTLIEKNDYLGGHTRTIKVDDHNIDTGFIVYNEKNYPYLKNFFEILNVKTANSDMSFSFSIKNKDFEYGGSGFKAIFAQPKNIFSLKFLLLLNEIRKLYINCDNLIATNDHKKMSLDEYLEKNRYSKNIRDFHIYPIISSIWSSNKKDIKNFPFISFLNFFKNHGLFNFNNRPQWKYVSGGSRNYIDKILLNRNFNYLLNCEVERIFRNDNEINIKIKNQKEITVDILVMATHADQCLSLIDNPSEEEKSILSNFNYSKNTAILHSDETFMPKKKSAWSSWNFLNDDTDEAKFSLTYWMNNLQKIDSNKNYFVTINPFYNPRKVYDSTTFEHPIYNLKTIQAQKKISNIQGYLNTFYCGSYCGYGFHEDGIQSAAYIANIFNIKIPWKIEDNLENRLYYNEKLYE